MSWCIARFCRQFNEMIESIFGCLERIEEKLDQQPVQTEQGESENNGNLAEELMPLVDSMNRTSRNFDTIIRGIHTTDSFFFFFLRVVINVLKSVNLLVLEQLLRIFARKFDVT